MRYPQGRIMVFARAPLPGATKTRLIPALGNEGAAKLHNSLIIHIVKRVYSCDLSPLDLFCTPALDAPVFRACAEVCGATRMLQEGANLGERMFNAFERTLRHQPWAILVGSDCPSITCTDLLDAAAHLQAGTDAVIGPAADGGYYLIGLRRNDKTLFTDMPWGTRQVLALTDKVMKTLAWNVHRLPVRRDIDVPRDLEFLPELEH